jgi:hypothetical protein
VPPILDNFRLGLFGVSPQSHAFVSPIEFQENSTAVVCLATAKPRLLKGQHAFSAARENTNAPEVNLVSPV